MKSLVLKVDHNSSTPIIVTYRVEPKDQSAGFDITVAGELWARVFNPADVTRWFARNSAANMKTWQTAYHASGFDGSEMKRPSPNDIVLEVAYYSQRDNARYPNGTCNVTSYAMDMNFLGVKRKTVNGKDWPQLEDELSAYMEAHDKDRHSHEDLVWLAEQYGLDASFRQDRTWDKIRAEIRAGFPVVVSGLFTSAGHIIDIIGLKGKDFIVNDPFGNALTHYKSRNGAGIVYDFAFMDKTVRGGSNSKWAHFIRRK